MLEIFLNVYLYMRMSQGNLQIFIPSPRMLGRRRQRHETIKVDCEADEGSLRMRPLLRHSCAAVESKQRNNAWRNVNFLRATSASERTPGLATCRGSTSQATSTRRCSQPTNLSPQMFANYQIYQDSQSIYLARLMMVWHHRGSHENSLLE